jgi:hypothetical protein
VIAKFISKNDKMMPLLETGIHFLESRVEKEKQNIDFFIY